MTYHCGIGSGMAALGFTPCEPYLLCDGCGARYEIVKRGVCCAPNWLLDNKAPKGWGYKRAEPKTMHYCPDCNAHRRWRSSQSEVKP
jgi:hypothetical protein